MYIYIYIYIYAYIYIYVLPVGHVPGVPAEGEEDDRGYHGGVAHPNPRVLRDGAAVPDLPGSQITKDTSAYIWGGRPCCGS